MSVSSATKIFASNYGTNMPTYSSLNTQKIMNEYDYDVQRKKTERERYQNIKVLVDTNFHWSLNVIGKRMQLHQVWV